MGAGNIFNLGGPPRHVPLPLKLENLLGSGSSGGCIMFGFFLIGFWVLTLKADLTGWYHFRGAVETAEGKVTRSETVRSRSKRGRRRTRFYANHYSFIGPDGIEYTGVSYTRRADKKLDAGTIVTVEHPSGKPEISRIRGMDRATMGWFAGLVAVAVLVVFLAAFLGMMVKGFQRGMKANRLLRDGQQAMGKLISKVKTRRKVGSGKGGLVYALTFEFTTEDRQSQKVVVKTHLPEKLEDEAEEPLLYDPMRPSNAAMLDELPGNPRIDEAGNIQTGSALETAVGLALNSLPFAATIIGHGIYVYLRFFAG
jgi:hypothetical protein